MLDLVKRGIAVIDLNGKRNIFLAGIGGVSMSALALTLIHMGHNVSGCDRTKSKVTDMLEKKGAKVFIGHNGENVRGADFIIRTAAVKMDAPEMIAAKEQGIPVFDRPEAWGFIMREFSQRICVAGTHGKSSTTGFCTHIAIAAGIDPGVMIGAGLPAIDGTLNITETRDMFIAESCEYCNSFLSFYPTVALINNIEEDHLDFFRDLDDIKNSFRIFAELVPENGAVAANYDDENVRDTLKDVKKRIIWFGLTGGDITASNIEYTNGFASFDLIIYGENTGRVKLSVPGEYSVSNALAAAASMIAANIKTEHIKAGIESFTGISRRFEIKGRVNGALVVDDYAHHPTEMLATMKAAKSMGFDRVICIFQPHTFSRTKELYDDFVAVLKLCDVPAILPVYAARETDRLGVDERKLAEEVGGIYIDSFEAAAEYIKTKTTAGDLVITMGAGDVTNISNYLFC